MINNALASRPIPRRLNVLYALRNLLSTIHPGNGYAFDIRGSIYIGKAQFGMETPLPAVSILEAPRGDFGQFAEEGTSRSDTWALLIQGWAPDDVLNPTIPAYYLAEDVESTLGKAMMTSRNTGAPLYPEYYRLGNLVTSLSISPPVVRPPDAASAKAYFYLPVRLGLAMTISNQHVKR